MLGVIEYHIDTCVDASLYHHSNLAGGALQGAGFCKVGVTTLGRVRHASMAYSEYHFACTLLEAENEALSMVG